MSICHYAFVQIHGMYSKQSKPSCRWKKKSFRRLGDPKMKCRTWQENLTIKNVWNNLTEGVVVRIADLNTFWKSRIYIIKGKRNCTKTMYSGWLGGFPWRYRVTILKSLYMYFGIEWWSGWQMMGARFLTVGVGIYIQARGGGYQIHEAVD